VHCLLHRPALAAAIALCVTMAGGVAASAQSGLSPDAQRACATSDASVLRECARSCFFVCGDRNIRTENEAIGRFCSDLMQRPRREDTRACPDVLARTEAPKQASTPPIDTTYAQTEQRCNANFPGVGESIIPVEGPPPPQCFRSFLNLECRFQGLAGRTARFRSTVEQFRSRDYSQRKGAAMCDFKRSLVENDYKAANQVQKPIADLKGDFEREFGCLDQFRTWLNSLPCTQEESRSICDQRNESIRELVTTRLSGSIKASEQLGTALTAATNAVNDIRAFWNTYRVVCF
jgi:hypothetical protein